MDSTLTEIKELQNPNVFITSVTFNDGTILPLPHNSIVVFTGANNSGKSQALKDVEHLFNTQWNVKPTVVSKVDREFWGEFNTGYMDSHFYKNAKGGFSMYESRSYNYSSDSIISGWKNKQLAGDLYKLFIRLINTEARLTSSRALHRTNDSDGHPIFKLCKSEELAQAISDYFKEAFGFDLVVNRNEMTNIPLCVGNAPNKKEYTMDQHDAYYDVINKMSRLDEQGDGMRSFASILLNTFTSEHTITLIDEPEAFLHPPQARLLGKMLATHNQNARQLFVATHSNDFLQGLLDAKNDNVIVIRINRVGNTNHMSILDHTKIRELWKNPILRYSNILSRPLKTRKERGYKMCWLSL